MRMAPVDAAVTYLRQYLDAAAAHGRSWVIDPAPLTQSIEVHSEHWRDGIESLELDDDVRAGIEQALQDVAARGDHVDRSLITAYAQAAGDSPAALVRCWFAVMAWGAGPQNRSRLRQWVRAIPTAGFVEALEQSHTELAAGRHAAAYTTIRALPGLGEAYLTKWLWALGLGGGVPDPQPYILDNYVWQTLNRLGWSAQGRNNAERWVDFCRTTEGWADQVAEAHPDWHIDGGRVEQVLFDRGRYGTHFYAWLGDHQAN